MLELCNAESHPQSKTYISTSSMLDAVQEVATVVHYQLPASADMYVHRSGRTGRAGTEGTSIALVTPRDAPRFAALLQVGAQGLVHSDSRCLACEAIQTLQLPR